MKTTSWFITIKRLETNDKGKFVKAVRENSNLPRGEKTIQMLSDISSETM